MDSNDSTANVVNRQGPAPIYPSRPPSANVPPPSPVAVNGTIVKKGS